MPTGIYPRPSLEERFWGKVLKTGYCWLWQGNIDANGYGTCGNGETTVKVHRVAYELEKGLIPEGLTIDHLCRNRGCVNPTHLEAVTLRENIRRGIRVNKTHCLKGHPYDKVNTYHRPDGSRECKICKQANQIKRRIKGGKK